MTLFILVFFRLLYTREQSAELLAVSLRKIDQLLARGELRSCRIDDCVRVHVAELIRFAGERSAVTGNDTAEGSHAHS